MGEWDEGNRRGARLMGEWDEGQEGTELDGCGSGMRESVGGRTLWMDERGETERRGRGLMDGGLG